MAVHDGAVLAEILEARGSMRRVFRCPGLKRTVRAYRRLLNTVVKKWLPGNRLLVATVFSWRNQARGRAYPEIRCDRLPLKFSPPFSCL